MISLIFLIFLFFHIILFGFLIFLTSIAARCLVTFPSKKNQFFWGVSGGSVTPLEDFFPFFDFLIFWWLFDFSIFEIS